MSQAYQKICLDEPSKNLVVINTPKGLSNTIDYRLGYLVHQESFKELWAAY